MPNIYGISLDEATKDMRKAIDDFDGKSVILYDEFDGVQVEGKAHWTSSTWKSVDPQKGFCWVKLNSDLKYLMPVANDLPFTISLIEDLGRQKQIRSAPVCFRWHSIVQRGFTGISSADL